jgi:nitrite reductase/ring-hydroxylating ferredoxin subunit/uncharacterized membrane protein
MDLVETIENVETLDKAANPIASAIGRAVPAGPVKDVLSGTQLGHPVHPVLTDVVIGAWTSSLVLDLVGGPSAREASDRLIAVGLAAAAPTAVSGLSDWADTEGKTRRIGLVHAGVNVGANLCYGASLAARRRGARGAGIALSLTGAGVMTLGAYLGGHLSFRKGVGVDETAFDQGPSGWTPVMDETDLPLETATPATVEGIPLLLFRSADTIHAIHDRCSHRGGPLHEGECDGETVTCPWHGSTFRLTDGGIVRGPAIAPQPHFETRVVGGKVEVRRDPAQQDA